MGGRVTVLGGRATVLERAERTARANARRRAHTRAVREHSFPTQLSAVDERAVGSPSEGSQYVSPTPRNIEDFEEFQEYREY